MSRIGTMAKELDREQILRDWLSEWGARPPVFGWASEFLTRATQYQPELAWSLILSLIERAADDDILGCVAAGPLEDLLCLHGAEVIDRVEICAAADERVRKCLAGVWGPDGMEPSIYRRICDLAPGKRPPGEHA